MTKKLGKVVGPPTPNNSPKPVVKNPTKQSKEVKLVLLDSGIEAVRLLTSAQEGSYERRLFSVLDKIGVAEPLTNIWKWQDQEICAEFIRNWDHKEKKTTVFGIYIDASLSNFSLATGLDSDPTTAPSPTYAGQHATKTLLENFCGADLDHEKAGKTQPLTCNSISDTFSRDLMLLLNKTLWLADKSETHLFKTCVFLLVKALEGRIYGWGRCVHDRFIASIYQQVQNAGCNPDKKTLAGPLMCFLFAHARYKFMRCRQVFQNDRVEVVHTKEIVSKAVEDLNDRVEGAHGTGIVTKEDPSLNDVVERVHRTETVTVTKEDQDQNSRVERVDRTETVSKENRGKAISVVDKICKTVSSSAALDLPTACLSKKRAREDFIRVGSPLLHLSARLPGGSKASVLPSSAEKPSKRQCLDTSADLDRLSGSSLGALDLTSKLQELEAELDRKKKEISRLLLVEAKVQELELDLDRKKKEISQLLLVEVNYEAQIKKFQMLYAEEQKHVQDCLKLHFDSVVAEDEASELRAKLKALTDMCRESSRRESFLELQLADMRRRWDMEFPLREKRAQEVCNMPDVTLRLKTGSTLPTLSNFKRLCSDR